MFVGFNFKLLGVNIRWHIAHWDNFFFGSVQGLRPQISSKQLVGIQFLQGNIMRDVILRFVNWFWRNRRSWEWKVPTFSFTTPNSYGRKTATKCEGRKPSDGRKSISDAIPSGKLTMAYGKSQFFMGKLIISMAIFGKHFSFRHAKCPLSRLWGHFSDRFRPHRGDFWKFTL